MSSKTFLIQLNRKVVRVDDGTVTLEDGETIHGRQIVIATPGRVVKELLQIKEEDRSMGESCLYYSTDCLYPFKERFLLLNGVGRGPVDNIAFPSMVAPDYASAGKTLIAVTFVNDHFRRRTDLEDEVRKQCRQWFGDAADDWKHLRTCQ